MVKTYFHKYTESRWFLYLLTKKAALTSVVALKKAVPPEVGPKS
jgi:hypothetical protein